MAYLIFALALLGNGILGCLIGRLGKGLLTLLGDMDTFDLVGGVTHEREDLRLVAFIPVRRKQLMVAKSDRVISLLGVEQGILEVDMLNEGMLQSLEATGIDLMPVLNKHGKE